MKTSQAWLNASIPAAGEKEGGRGGNSSWAANKPSYLELMGYPGD